MKASEGDYRRRSLAACCREFGFSWGGVIGATLGLGLIMSGVLTPLDEAEVWWEWLVAVPLGLMVIVLGCGVVIGSAGRLFQRIALGWYGVLLGKCPDEGYGPRANNGARAIANGLYAVVAMVLGVVWFRAGSADGQLNWAMEGLLLAFSGVAFGLGSLVPRLYFKRSGRKARVCELKLPEVWTGLMIAATLGVGLSFGVCKGFAEAKARAEIAAEKASE